MADSQFDTQDGIDSWYRGAFDLVKETLGIDIESLGAEEFMRLAAWAYGGYLGGINKIRTTKYERLGLKAPPEDKLSSLLRDMKGDGLDAKIDLLLVVRPVKPTSTAAKEAETTR